MSSARIFVGRLAHRATERDLDDFFRKSGKIRDIGKSSETETEDSSNGGRGSPLGTFRTGQDSHRR